jgi:hypothetical protein
MAFQLRCPINCLSVYQAVKIHENVAKSGYNDSFQAYENLKGQELIYAGHAEKKYS